MEEFIPIIKGVFQFIATLTIPILLYLQSRKSGHIKVVSEKFDLNEKLLKSDDPYLVEQTYSDLHGCTIDFNVFKRLTTGPGSAKRIQHYNNGSPILLTKDGEVSLIMPVRLVKFLEIKFMVLFIAFSIAGIYVINFVSKGSVFTWLMALGAFVFSYIMLKFHDTCLGAIKTIQVFKP